MKTTRIRKERIKRGWTQNFVADYCGVAAQTVCDWEKGRHRPTYDTLDKLEELFGLSHRELFAPADDEKPFSSTN